jgi:genome maintenance exonuclease 1
VLYLDELEVAGRVDLIADFDGELAVIDFKGSTKIKEEYHIKSYLIQETFYALAYSKMFGEKVQKIVTIMATEASDTPQLFVKKPSEYISDLIDRVKIYKEMQQK